MKFALIQLGEYAHVLGTSFLGALLFLGAWAGPGPGVARARSGSCSRRCSCSCSSPGSAGASSASASIRFWRCRGSCCCRPRCCCSSPPRSSSSGGPVADRDTEPAVVVQLSRRRERAMRITLLNLFRKPVTVHYPDKRARVSRSLPRPARARLRAGHRRGGLHRLPAVRVRLPAGGDQGRDAQEREAELRQDLHARALRLRVLRAVRAGLPDRRHRHDEVVRHGDRRSPRDAARQGPAARDRPAASAASWATGNRLRDMQAPPKMARAEHAAPAAPAAKPAGGEA